MKLFNLFTNSKKQDKRGNDITKQSVASTHALTVTDFSGEFPTQFSNLQHGEHPLESIVGSKIDKYLLVFRRLYLSYTLFLGH